MSDYGVLPSRAQVPHVPLTCTQCSTPIEYLAPSPPPPPGTPLRIRCYKCSAIITHQVGPNQTQASTSSSTRPSGANTPQPQARKRKIGTQERPLETAYYEILGVEVTATSDDIKKAYRRLAIKHHPDKNRDDPSAEETFKQISIAYQVLSDPELRKKYNEFGPKEGTPDAGFVDPEEIFSAIFGGERFVPIIGHISLGKDMKDALQNEESDNEEPTTPVQRDAKGREVISPEERARREEKRRRKEEREKQVEVQKQKVRKERVSMLVTELARKLSIYTESATGHPQQDADVADSWRQICEIEANELKSESYGVELLHAIGFVYVSKSKHYLATNQTFMGMGGWLHNIQGKYHVFSETVSTVRSALELKQVFDQIAEAEKAGLSPEEKKKLEDQAAEKGLRALFKGAKLEVESVLRETCDLVLSDPSLQSSKLHLRAVALQILGEAYLSVKKEGEAAEDDYVRIETKASRERAASSAHR
ncbi:J domain-containing protein C3E7,11c [Ceratobasidium theobromae]|uniref:J domain-containing protein C3E7,11c n=1 Tax=Ceratobasidium theobromae TaxID=1582974 RepID=A0A5N5QBX5_9AGAM|nr:J domain-containing protein C3E7,11c [Ceratobasidium theobromae]